MSQRNITLDLDFVQELLTELPKGEVYKKFLEKILNEVLIIESTKQLKAEPYERTDERTSYRNGFRDRPLLTRLGSITLRVPRHRNGNFSTEIFQRYQRSEQALILSMVEMVINGVSTRKIAAITKELCGENISKSTVSNLCKILDPVVSEFRNRNLKKHYPFVMVDAIYLKVREENKVVSKGLLIALGINENGNPEILGFEIANSESEESWGNFFQTLKNRGLNNIDYIVSDNNLGLVNAVQKHFQEVLWQRCQTHFSKNVLSKVPKELQKTLKSYLHSIYNASNIKQARSLLQQTIEEFEHKAPKAIQILEDGFDDITAVFNLPEKYRKRLRTSNYLERLNEEIRRRDRVIRIYPNEASAIRLIGALLIEQHEKWLSGHKYLIMQEYHEFVKNEKTETKKIIEDS